MLCSAIFSAILLRSAAIGAAKTSIFAKSYFGFPTGSGGAFDPPRSPGGPRAWAGCAGCRLCGRAVGGGLVGNGRRLATNRLGEPGALAARSRACSRVCGRRVGQGIPGERLRVGRIPVLAASEGRPKARPPRPKMILEIDHNQLPFPSGRRLKPGRSAPKLSDPQTLTTPPQFPADAPDTRRPPAHR